MALSPSIVGLLSAVPVPAPTPDAEQAREWARRELSDPAYAAAEPNWFDRIAREIANFLDDLFRTGSGGDWGPTLALIVGIVAVVAIVAAILIWGRPRLSRRAAASAGSMLLFGEEEARSAAELRAAAATHAQRGEWDAATVLRFRALARGLLEREAVHPPPGATVHAFARAAARAFPGQAGELESAASAFDDVRYLRRPGTEQLYRRIAAADDDVARAEPVDAGAVIAR